jgi:meso-butanediol dehydrogenase / (S,S)-butanediol dehydrogenase / diacetyl reductase
MGRAGAIRFAAEGARLVGCDLNADTAMETTEAVRRAGGEIATLAPLDLTAEDASAELTPFAAATFGGFDVLWNNAGAQRLGTAGGQVADFEFTLTHELTLASPRSSTRCRCPSVAVPAA